MRRRRKRQKEEMMMKKKKRFERERRGMGREKKGKGYAGGWERRKSMKIMDGRRGKDDVASLL